MELPCLQDWVNGTHVRNTGREVGGELLGLCSDCGLLCNCSRGKMLQNWGVGGMDMGNDVRCRIPNGYRINLNFSFGTADDHHSLLLITPGTHYPVPAYPDDDSK